jgi:hypothetical protein
MRGKRWGSLGGIYLLPTIFYQKLAVMPCTVRGWTMLVVMAMLLTRVEIRDSPFKYFSGGTNREGLL